MDKIQIGIDLVTTNIDGKIYSPTDIAALILEKAYSDAQKKYPSAKDNTLQAIITIPEHFTFNQLTETAKSGQNAGFEILRVITKPVEDSLSEKNAEIEVLQNKIDVLNEQNKKLTDDMKSMENVIAEKDEKIENLQNKISGSNDQHSKLSDNLKTLGKAVNEKDEQIKSLQNKITELSNENSRLSENVKSMEKSDLDKTKKLTEAENFVKEKTSAMDKLNSEKNTLVKAIETQKKEDEDLKKAVEWLRNYANTTDQKVLDYFAHKKHTLESHNRFLTYQRFNNPEYVQYLNGKNTDSNGTNNSAKTENNSQQDPKRKGAIRQIKDFFYTNEEEIDDANDDQSNDAKKK